jgi:hypothetical protein
MPVGRGIAAALLTLAALGGCTEVSTVPEVPLSLQFDSLPALAVVVGDTMRGATLAPASVPIRAFDGSGGVVSDSQLRLIGIDTTSVRAFGVISGFRIVGLRETAAVRVVAQAGPLQSQTQTFAVVPVPTGIVKSTTVSDSIVYDRLDTSLRFVDIGVNVIRQIVPDSTVVSLNGLRVRFTVDSFSRAILDSVRVVGTGTGRAATSAVVNAGAATLRLKAYARAGATGRGVVRLQVSHLTRGVPTAGSPFTLTVRLVPFTVSSGAVNRIPAPLAPSRAFP